MLVFLGHPVCILKIISGNGDIPDLDDKVVDVAREVLEDDFDETELKLCYTQLYINGKSLCDNKPGGSQSTRGTGKHQKDRVNKT